MPPGGLAFGDLVATPGRQLNDLGQLE